MKLYEIEASILSATEAMIDKETGEVNVDIEATLGELEIDREKKVLNIGKVILNYQAEVDAFKEAEKRMAKRRATVERKVAGLKEWVASYIPGETFKDAEVKLSWRKSESVSVIDESLIPSEFIRVIPETTQPDKMAIKKSLKAENEVAGCELKKSASLQVK